MPKFTLTLNSHSLSMYQECEEKFMYSHFIGIESPRNTFAMDRGTEVAKFLQLLYYNRIKPHASIKKVLNNPILWTNRFSKRLNIPNTEAFELYRACVKYTINYKDNDWKPVAVEKGFSKVLYEDDENLFVWEGRPDLIVSHNGEIFPVDHKCQARKNDIYAFNNQARGYVWAIGSTKFVYNYIVLTKIPNFERQPHQFTLDQINDWKLDTIEWFKRIRESILRAKFTRSWNCQTKYGVCDFRSICEQPRINIKGHIIKGTFKTKKVYRSW